MKKLVLLLLLSPSAIFPFGFFISEFFDSKQQTEAKNIFTQLDYLDKTKKFDDRLNSIKEMVCAKGLHPETINQLCIIVWNEIAKECVVRIAGPHTESNAIKCKRLYQITTLLSDHYPINYYHISKLDY